MQYVITQTRKAILILCALVVLASCSTSAPRPSESISSSPPSAKPTATFDTSSEAVPEVTRGADSNSSDQPDPTTPEPVNTGGDKSSDSTVSPATPSAAQTPLTNDAGKSEGDSDKTSGAAIDGKRSWRDTATDPAVALVMGAGFYEWTPEDLDSYAEAYREASIRREEFIGPCMAEKGFDYFIPNVGRAVWLPQYLDKPGTIDWMDRYGLGVSTTWFPQRLLGSSAIGYEGADRPQPDISERSEETQYLNSLSKEAYSEYRLALEGHTTSSSGALIRDPEAVASSCRGQAFQLAPDPIPVLDNQAELVERIFADPKWLAFQSEGWRCVKAAGYNADSQQSAENLVYQMRSEVGLEEHPALQSLTRDASAFPSELVEVLDEIQVFEHKLAKTMWNCGIHPSQERDIFASLAEDVVGS